MPIHFYFYTHPYYSRTYYPYLYPAGECCPIGVYPVRQGLADGQP
jgi:hypothetical protein